MARKLNDNLKTNLLGSDLWMKKLQPDCIAQEVFMAIRNNKIGFYYKGGLLFKFDKDGFSTHIKYAAVIESKGSDYLTEDELNTHKLTTDFSSTYKRIKENCSNYSGIEAKGVAEIYHKHSYLSNDEIVVLDVELSLESLDKANNKYQDRIDIVLLNKKTKTLQLVEAKHFSNSEIWSTKTPHVIGQINRYENQIKAKQTNILKDYSEYIEVVNDIFKINLPLPTQIEPKVILLIFGFDSDQLKGRFSKLILNKTEYKGIKIYKTGGVKDFKTKALWNAKEL